MRVVVEEDFALGRKVLAIWLQKHHAAPLVNDPPLRHKAQLLVRDSVAEGWDLMRGVFDNLVKLLLLGVPLLDLFPYRLRLAR